MINHPPHYRSHPSGLECIDITRLMSFDLGNAVKYIWRYVDKNGNEDLRKARWYLQDILSTGQASHPPHKAKRLLMNAIAAEPSSTRSELFELICTGDLGPAAEYITTIVGLQK